MKRAKIIYKEIIKGDIKGVEILGWKNIAKKEELPKSYLNGAIYFYEDKENKCVHIVTPFDDYVCIKKHSIKRLEDFELLIKEMKKAGNLLSEILHDDKMFNWAKNNKSKEIEI